MSKKTKILTALIVLILILFLYLTLTSRPLNNEPGARVNDQSEIDKGKLRSDYKTAVNKILDEYGQLVEDGGIEAGKEGYLKNWLLELKVPVELKQLHLNLVLALTKLGNYFESGDEDEKAGSQQLVEQAGVDYDWLGK